MREHLRLQREIAKDLGLVDLSVTEKFWLAQLATLVQRAAMIQAQLERNELSLKRAAELTKVTSESRRVYLMLKGSAAAAAPQPPTLSDYLATLAASKRDQRPSLGECEAIDNEDEYAE